MKPTRRLKRKWTPITEEPPRPDQQSVEELESRGIKIRTVTELDPVLPELDVVYINAISWEGDTFNTYGSAFHLTADSPLKKDAIILI